MSRRYWTIIVLVAALVCFCISALYLVRDRETEKHAVTIERMTSNKVVSWYTSLPLSDAESIGNAFTTETGIGVTIVRNSALIIRDQLLREIESGSTSADVITIADIGTYVELKTRGELLEFDSPYYSQYESQYKDSGYWVVFAGFGICMAYNEDLLDEPPLHWEDLLDERWRGRIGLENIHEAGSQYGQYYMLRELLGVDFWRRLLSEQQPRLYSQTTDLADALLQGEIDIAGEFTTNAVYSYRTKKGIPIQGVYPDEGVPFVVNPTAILKRAVNQDESRIFFNYILSRKGQSIMQATNFKYSVLADIKPLEGLPPINTLNLLLPENALQYDLKKDQYIQEFDSFLGNAQ